MIELLNDQHPLKTSITINHTSYQKMNELPIFCTQQNQNNIEK